MATRWRLLRDGAAAGPWNMGVDEALLASAIADGRPALRLYRWDGPWLSLGYGQALAVERRKACIAAGVACLWGPAHGGANQSCLEMLREIGTPERIPEYLERAKDKADPFRLMGFGHRVYKNYDPRAKVMEESAKEVLDLLGVENNPTLQVAQELEHIATSDPYFVEKKLYPNVDFYSGIILDAIGFPTSMFTPIFALARTAGWISQWKEMIADPSQKIGRPRQLYTGKPHRGYVEVDDR